MKLVTFGRAMSPHGVGDTRLVPDDVAARLEGEGVLLASEVWPPRADPAMAERPRRPIVKPVRPAGELDLRVAR